MSVAGRPAGCWGDVGVLSFGGSKPLTAGRGGAVVTSEATVAARWRTLLDRPSDAVSMSPLQAAALLPQLKRLPECNRKRARAIGWLEDALSENECILPADPGAATFYKLAFETTERSRWLAEFERRGIPVGAGYRSMHRSSDRRCRKVGELVRSQRLGERLCLLDHRALLTEPNDRENLVTAMKLR